MFAQKKSDPSNSKKSARASRSLCALRAHVCPPIINRCPLLAPPLFKSWCRHWCHHHYYTFYLVNVCVLLLFSCVFLIKIYFFFSSFLSIILKFFLHFFPAIFHHFFLHFCYLSSFLSSFPLVVFNISIILLYNELQDYSIQITDKCLSTCMQWFLISG